MKKPWFIMGSFGFALIVSGVSGVIAQGLIENSADLISTSIVNIFDIFVVQVFVGMGLTAFALKADNKTEDLRFSDLWAPHRYWKYLATSVLVSLAGLAGILLFIIPGIIATVLLIFAPYMVIDKGYGPIEAIKMSFDKTKEHFWGIFLLLTAVIVLNILGALFVGIGLIVTIPVSFFAVIHAYRMVG